MEKPPLDNTGNLKQKKDNFKLDFNVGKRSMMKPVGLPDGILSSPDVGLLKLATPDLERFLVHPNSVGQISTPTQILFPKTVTEEQEAYARGFIDALVELHRQQAQQQGAGLVNVDGGPPGPGSFIGLASLPISSSEQTKFHPDMPVNLSMVHPVSTVGNSQDGPVQRLFSMGSPTVGTKTFENDRCASQIPTASQSKPETVQTVPVFEGRMGSVSPIDMSNQELQKLERRREKNRYAAQKCRNRKLERISRLEDRVEELKSQNARLAQVAAEHRDQVFRIKQQIVEHVNSGCQVMGVSDAS